MNLFTFIKERVAIEDIAREYVSLKKTGIYYKGTCPFHQEKDASFTISPNKGIFYCFGCHATGDVISFISQMEGCNQFEAAKFLIEKYSIDIPEQLLQEKKDSTFTLDEKNRYFSLCELMAKWCNEQLNQSAQATIYLNDRNIAGATVKQFDIGYFPSGIKAIKYFQRFAQQHGFLIKDLTDAHLLIEGKNHHYSPFEERIVFPITDHLGRYCGFGGRIFQENDERAKYYNSHENSFFNKGALLFGLHQAKKDIQKKGAAFLVEGYTDCITMVQYGYQNTIATLGTACTPQHLKQLSHYADQLYVLFDGDSAGLQAALRLTQLCWDVNINMWVVQLPNNEDPASYLKAGNDLSENIKNAEDIFSFFIRFSTQQFKHQPLKKKMAIVREILNIINAIDDDLKKIILLQEAAFKLSLPFEALAKECHQFHGLPAQKTSVDNSSNEGEKKLFGLLIENPYLLEREDIIIMCSAFSEPLKTIINKYKLLSQKTFAHLTEQLDENEKQLTQQLLITHAQEKVNIELIIREFAKRNWKTIALNTKEKIAEAQKRNDDQEVKVLLQKLQELKKKVLNWSVQ